MNRANLKKMIVATVAIFGLSLCAVQANAGWWWGGGWDCCAVSACVPCCDCYSGCYSHGCHRSCHRGCGYGCYSYGCGYGCSSCYDPCPSCYTSVSCCGGCGGCGSSLGYWGSPVVSSCGCGGSVGVPVVEQGVMPAMPVVPPTAAPAAAPVETPKPSATPPSPSLTPNPAAPAGPAATPANPPLGIPNANPPVLSPDNGTLPLLPGHTSIESGPGESGVLTVWVPYEAKVTINGMLTKSTGSKRHFVSYGLQPGYTYKYEVKAEVVREGKIVTERQTVSLTAGDRGGVAFGFNNPPENLAAAE